MPGIGNVGRLLWEKAKDFLQRAFTIILLATIVIWLLQGFDFRFNAVSDAKDSMLATVAGLLVPLMKPAGLGDWKICTSLLTGFMAKESVVSTLEVLYAQGIQTALSVKTALSFLVFSLLYTPCVAAIASIKRELGHKWAVGVVLWQCFVAWLFAVIVHLITLLF